MERNSFKGANHVDQPDNEDTKITTIRKTAVS